MKNTLVLVMLLVLSGCMVMLPTASIHTNQSPEEILKRLTYGAERCWRSPKLDIEDDILVATREFNGGAEFIARRVNASGGRHFPFLVVTLKPVYAGTEISVKETDFNLGQDLNLSQDVHRWIIQGGWGCA